MDHAASENNESGSPLMHLEVVRAGDAATGPVEEASTKRRTATKKASWRAWTGTIGDLRKINTWFEELALARREEIARQWPEGLLRESKIEDLSPETELVTVGDETVSGRFDAVVDELDPRTWAKLTFIAGKEHSAELHRLVLRRIPDFDGKVVELTIKSADPGTAASSFTRLSEQVELGNPTWSWLHRTWVQLTLGFIPLLALIVTVQIGLYPWWRTQSLFSVQGLAFAAAAVVIPILAGHVIGHHVDRVIRRLVPPCEVRYDGAPQSTGSRRIGALVAVWVSQILIGPVFAFLTSRH